MTDSSSVDLRAPRTRVLVIVQGLGIGGTERAAVNYAVLYNRLGCDVSVYGIYSGGPIQAKLEKEGIRSVCGFPAIKELCRVSQCQEYSLIHVNSGGPYDPVIDAILSALKGSRTRVVQTNVFARSDYGPSSKLIDLELLISCTGFWKWSAHSRSSQRQRPAAVLPYLVSSQRFYSPSRVQQLAARKSLGIHADAHVFGRVGQPSMNKWDPRLADVCVDILSRISNACFVFLGCPPALQARLQRKEILRNKICFLPPSVSDKDLQKAYSAMDVFLHLSRIGESFGLVLVEAAQAGIPTATLATPLKDDAQGEVVRRIEAGGEAWTVRDLASLAIQLAEQVHADPSFRQRISAQANQSFGIDSQFERFSDFFNSVISLDPEKLAGRFFCPSFNQSAFADLFDSADEMRMRRQVQVRRHRGLICWLAFLVIYSPKAYRLYRMLQEHRYLKRQLSRAVELRRLLLDPLSVNGACLGSMNCL